MGFTNSGKNTTNSIGEANIEEPFVSIISPVYNTPSDCLRRSIRSILDQTYPQFELILVDDGSMEPCAELCDSIAQQDPRIHVIHQVNRGFSGAMNSGIDAAVGDSIMFIDPDDEMVPIALEHAVATMLQYECDMVCATSTIRFPDKDINGAFSIEGSSTRLLDDDELHSYRIYCLTSLFPKSKPDWFGTGVRRGHVAKLYRTKLFSEVRLDEEMLWGSDTIMLADVLARCERVVFVNELWYVYYMNEFSGTHSLTFAIDEHDRNAMGKRVDLFSKDAYCAASFVRFCATSTCVARSKGAAAVPEIRNYLKRRETRKIFDGLDIDELSLSEKQKVVAFLGKRRMYLILAIVFYAKALLDMIGGKKTFN